MTASAQLQITDAIMATLRESPPVAARIQRGRTIPAQLTADTVASVRLVRSNGTRLSVDGVATTWHTAIAIEVGARAAADSDAHAAVDPVLQAAYARIHAAPPAGGAWDWSGDPEIHWQIDEAESTVGLATLVLPITHITGSSLTPLT